ncbi:MAG: MoxR family ATPase [Deltaproteobacteria bacterium]|nr:MoxR family ATPase [Deltaproteobacteria bacterium]
MMDFNQSHQKILELKEELKKAVVGQEEVLDQVLVGLLSSGHVLLEGVPGLGKTLIVRALAKTFGGEFSRVQFTPDLMPSDILGHLFFDKNSSQFHLKKGPAFTNLLLADEINRSPAKTQAALLEVMQERQITLEGKSYPSLRPFMVLATQNPLEQEGTYALPEAELDRFLIKINLSYPSLEEELTISKKLTQDRLLQGFAIEDLKQVLSPDEVIELQNQTSLIKVDDQVLDYAIRLVRQTREHPGLNYGASVRASLSLIQSAKALALIRGQAFVSPDEIKSMALSVLSHRLGLSAELEIEGLNVGDVLKEIINQVEAPRQ